MSFVDELLRWEMVFLRVLLEDIWGVFGYLGERGVSGSWLVTDTWREVMSLGSGLVCLGGVIQLSGCRVILETQRNVMLSVPQAHFPSPQMLMTTPCVIPGNGLILWTAVAKNSSVTGGFSV